MHRENRWKLDELFQLLYDELKRLAHRRLSHEADGGSLQTTGLVHEVYLKLTRGSRTSWGSERDFKAAAAEAMRRVLIDRARRRKRQKRGGGWQQITFDEAASLSEDHGDQLLEIEEALEAFELVSPQKAEIVKMRFFAGLSFDDIARLTGTSRATVYRRWNYARAWLLRYIDRRRKDGAAGENDLDR